MANEKMLAAVYQGPYDMKVQEIERPACGPHDVVLRVQACGICGSDLHDWREGVFAHPGMIMGHEYIGEVVEVGEGVQGVQEGDRAFGMSYSVCGECYWCQRGQYSLCPELFPTAYSHPGAFAEYTRVVNAVPGMSIVQYPDELDDITAATAEPVSVAAFAVHQGQVQPGDKVIVLGVGLIGNVIVQLVKKLGATAVAVDLSPLRLEAAQRMGADAAINARTEDVLERAIELVGEGRYHFGVGAMADVVFECAGVPATVTQSLELVRSGGTVVYLGLAEEPAPILINKVVHKTPRLVGSFGGDVGSAMKLLAEGQVETRSLVTHEFPLTEIEKAFAIQNNVDESIKVVVMP